MAEIVIDANIGVALAINLAYSPQAEYCLTLWQNEQSEIAVPTLWQYEIVSAVRKAIVAKLISPTQASQALDNLFRLGIRSIEGSLESHRLALSWAARLGQTVAYDAQYLALAEQMGAEFWTADKKLAQIAQAQGAHWVRWLGEVKIP